MRSAATPSLASSHGAKGGGLSTREVSNAGTLARPKLVTYIISVCPLSFGFVPSLVAAVPWINATLSAAKQRVSLFAEEL